MANEMSSEKPNIVKRGLKGLVTAFIGAVIVNGSLNSASVDAISALVAGFILAADRWAQNEGYY